MDCGGQSAWPSSEANTALGRGEDERDHTAVARMLRAVGADRVRLLSNNPDKARQLDVLGVSVAERMPTGVHLTVANARYLTAKRDHTAHTLALAGRLSERHGRSGSGRRSSCNLRRTFSPTRAMVASSPAVRSSMSRRRTSATWPGAVSTTLS